MILQLHNEKGMHNCALLWSPSCHQEASSSSTIKEGRNAIKNNGKSACCMLHLFPQWPPTLHAPSSSKLQSILESDVGRIGWMSWQQLMHILHELKLHLESLVSFSRGFLRFWESLQASATRDGSRLRSSLQSFFLWLSMHPPTARLKNSSSEVGKQYQSKCQ